jgi:hypothetical protein
MMKVKAINGAEVEIGMDQMKMVHAEVEKRLGHFTQSNTTAAGNDDAHKHHHHHHKFMVGGKEMELTVSEMKEISNAWWEHYGKSGMEKFFEHYQSKAAGNIRDALGHCNVPNSEKEVKAAITQALASGDPCRIAEVMFEAMEWESAYFGLHSITD